LNKRLSTMRHDINNHLSLIVAAVELIRFKPQTSERWLSEIAQQSPRIAEAIRKFSTEFERTCGITKP